MVTGASIRYRFYSRWGITGRDLSKIVFSYSVTFWLGLFGVGKCKPPLRTVSKQPPEQWEVMRRGDDQDVPDACEHQRRQGIVDHWLVEHRKQLLRGSQRQGMQTRSRATGQDNALAIHTKFS